MQYFVIPFIVFLLMFNRNCFRNYLKVRRNLGYAKKFLHRAILLQKEKDLQIKALRNKIKELEKKQNQLVSNS